MRIKQNRKIKVIECYIKIEILNILKEENFDFIYNFRGLYYAQNTIKKLFI